MFYKNLFEGMPPAEALRRAKLFLIEGGDPDRGGSVADPDSEALYGATAFRDALRRSETAARTGVTMSTRGSAD